MEQNLFPDLQNSGLSYLEQKQSINTTIFVYLISELEVWNQPDAVLTHHTVTLASLSCDPGSAITASASSCPKGTVTYTSPLTSVSTVVCLFTAFLNLSD